MIDLLGITVFENNSRILYWSNSEGRIGAYFYENHNEYNDDEIDDLLDNDDDENMIDSSGLNEVGHVEISDEWLNYIEVSENFRRHKIAVKLVELAINHLGLENIACVKETDACEYSLSPEGEELIAYCIGHGIVQQDMCKFANVLNEGDGDIYDSQIILGVMDIHDNDSQNEEQDNIGDEEQENYNEYDDQEDEQADHDEQDYDGEEPEEEKDVDPTNISSQLNQLTMFNNTQSIQNNEQENQEDNASTP